MTDEQMKKLLEEDTGEVPERFHQAMLAAFGQMEDEPFDGTELPISVEAAEKPRRPRHVPRQGGRFGGGGDKRLPRPRGRSGL